MASWRLNRRPILAIYEARKVLKKHIKKALQEAKTPQSALNLILSLIGFYSITTVVQPCLSSTIPY